MLVQSYLERLRPLVGVKSWDYIVLWKLSNDHRCIEWMDCCCAGIDIIGNGGEVLCFEASSSRLLLHCRDITFPHTRNKPCDLLDQLPSSIVLDSGDHAYAESLLSNQASWINYSHNVVSCLSGETIGTRVLIPVSLGLVELFVTKQVPEDEKLIDFIKAQCIFFVEQQTMSINSGTTIAIDSFSSGPNARKEPLITVFQQQISPSEENVDLPQLDSINLNPLQCEFGNTSSETNNPPNYMEETAYETKFFTPSIENEFAEFETTQNGMRNKSSRLGSMWTAVEDQMNVEDSLNRSADSDPIEDEDDAKCRRRTGKGPQSKNLMAERKRRKKLNDRLYSLRALVPKISKLDRASILGDAIDYVNELKQQVEDLTIELEDHPDNEGTMKIGKDETEKSIVPPNIMHPNAMQCCPKRDNLLNSTFNNTVNISKQNQELHKVQQMEPQVEVFQIDGNDFFVKVFCEHESGGFVRLMEALSSLGLEVTHVNTTRHTCLVSIIFKVERKNDETVEANDVKESLLELTRSPSRDCLNVHISRTTTNHSDCDYRLHQQYSRQMNSHH